MSNYEITVNGVDLSELLEGVMVAIAELQKAIERPPGYSIHIQKIKTKGINNG